MASFFFSLNTIMQEELTFLYLKYSKSEILDHLINILKYLDDYYWQYSTHDIYQMIKFTHDFDEAIDSTNAPSLFKSPKLSKFISDSLVAILENLYMNQPISYLNTETCGFTL